MPRIFTSSLLTTLLFVSCSQPEKEPVDGGPGSLKVVSVNYPLHFFAERIGGAFIDATFPLPPGDDPAYWNPDADEIALFQQADLILTNGADYAGWLEKVSLPTSRMVNTSKAFSDSYIELEEGVTHTHGPGGKHEHMGFAFTTWLDFKNALAQAEAVKEAIVKHLPGAKRSLEENFRGLKADLIALDEKAAHATAQLTESTLYASHPVYQYFASGYNLSILSEHWEPGEMPSDGQWRVFANTLREKRGGIMLWEDEPLREVRDRLHNMGLVVTVFNPCGNRPKEGDFLTVMNSNLDRLAQTEE
ncbi:MAG: metal ABC transporter substrate-binding protein [Bacteroidota bacterium]